LEVVSNLDDATLIKEVDIVLSLKASTEGATTFGSATLVIKLPKKVAPAAFTQPYYEADYKLEEKTHSIELKNGPIDLDGDNIAETTVALTGGKKRRRGATSKTDNRISRSERQFRNFCDRSLRDHIDS
jgi:hypothetical protein